ncbi:MAG: hypothetical protein ACK5JF_09315 [Oscillospiraceae bacterium]
MKKLFTVALAAVLALALVACSGGKKADGVYTAKVDAAYAEANHGWTDELTLTYKDGKVVEAVYESYDADGAKKSESTEYAEAMTGAGGPSPAEWIPQLASNVVAAGSPDKVEVVAGATNASNSVIALYEGIEKDGKAGETITVTIPTT